MKKNKFDKKVRIHTKYLNQLSHFYQKAIDDGLITKEEMSEYSSILDEYEKEVNGVKMESDKIEDEFNLKLIQENAKQDAQKEIQRELANDFKMKELQKLKSQFHL